MKKIQKIIALLLVMAMVAPITAVFAEMITVPEGSQRVALGVDNSINQINTIYDTFGLKRGDVDEISITIDDEREYLAGKVDANRIGNQSFSSIYIKTVKAGSGLTIKLSNISWVTEATYRNALITLGIMDANISITAPFAVSGTAALTGVYKAYEDMTKTKISDTVKDVATEELVTTSELADDVGSEAAATIVNELKIESDKIKDMTNEEAEKEIVNIAEKNEIVLTEDQIASLLALARSFENIDFSKVEASLKDIAQSLGALTQNTEGFFGWISGVFEAIGDFFSNLFGNENGAVVESNPQTEEKGTDNEGVITTPDENNNESVEIKKEDGSQEGTSQESVIEKEEIKEEPSEPKVEVPSEEQKTPPTEEKIEEPIVQQ